ncbi:MAG TPA: VCBS repeat-containing protein [Candidatus Polarisedimenticolia bacterium]|nr:VCBS repeat-containing protein [Candidatus Polarisedimenticolia bacterium]
MNHHPSLGLVHLSIRPLLIAGFLLLPGTGVLSGAPLFPDPVFPVGLGPASVATADFNGDGKSDLVTANSVSNDLSILLGRGDGEFEPERRIAIDLFGHPTYAAAADLNADGKTDLVVTYNPNALLVFLGAGNGSFVLDNTYAVTEISPSFVTVADLNLDGVPDLAVASATPSVAVFLGQGDGTFQPETLFPAGADAYSLAVADFNVDGSPDILIAAIGSGAAVLFGNGHGQFDPPVLPGEGTGLLVEPSGGTSVLSQDFNRDGKPDLVTSDPRRQLVSELLGDGEGGILQQVVISIETGFAASPWLEASDFNGDGLTDLVTSVGVLFSHGDGTFDPLVPFTPITGPLDIQRSYYPHLGGGAVADFNGDGSLDLAGTDKPGGDVVMLLLSDRLAHPGPRAYVTENRADSILAGDDFNGDGLTDLASADTRAASIAILPGRVDGTFDPEYEIPSELGIASLVSGDFDGDGKTDLAYSTPPGTSVFMARGLGDGNFAPRVETMISFAPDTLVTGNFSADGRTDLIAFRTHAGQMLVLLGDSDGTFDVSDVIRPLNPSAAAVGDFDADGRQDIAVAYPDSRSVTIFPGLGDGTFATGGSFVAGSHLTSLTIADFNEDSLPDLAAGHASGPIICPAVLLPCVDGQGTVSILLGMGDGTFGAESRHDLNSSILRTADFDQDGHRDLLGDASTILFGTGDGTFDGLRQFARLASNPGGVIIDDFNRDGWPDVAFARGDIIVDLSLGAGAGGSLAAHAGEDMDIECAGPDGAEVMLDGSTSSGSISTFEWFEDFGQPGQRLLGTGVTLHATLGLGAHHITLRVADPAGTHATDEIIVTVADTVAPTLTVDLTPHLLWPANNKMVDVIARVQATDACGGRVEVKLASIQSGGPASRANRSSTSNVSGAELGTADFAFQLRAVKSSSKQGAAYLVTYTSTDAAGNQSSATGTVIVPHDHRDIPRTASGPSSP